MSGHPHPENSYFFFYCHPARVRQCPAAYSYLRNRHGIQIYTSLPKNPVRKYHKLGSKELPTANGESIRYHRLCFSIRSYQPRSAWLRNKYSWVKNKLSPYSLRLSVDKNSARELTRPVRGVQRSNLYRSMTTRRSAIESVDIV